MFDLSAVNKRYFDIKLNDLVLEVEAPKVKTLKKIVDLAKNSKKEEGLDGMTDAVLTFLKKNKGNKKIPPTIIDELDFDQMNEILTAFFEWLTGEKNSKN